MNKSGGGESGIQCLSEVLGAKYGDKGRRDKRGPVLRFTQRKNRVKCTCENVSSGKRDCFFFPPRRKLRLNETFLNDLVPATQSVVEPDWTAFYRARLGVCPTLQH